MFVDQRDRIDSIKSRQDLAQFVRELGEDFEKNPQSWENDTISNYMEALAGWIDDMGGYYKNQNQPVPETPEWKTFAQMLHAARYYE